MADFEDVPMSQESDLYFDAAERLTQYTDERDELMSEDEEESDEEGSLDGFDDGYEDEDEARIGRVSNEVVVDLTKGVDGDGDVDVDESSEDGIVENGDVQDSENVSLQRKALKPRNYQLEMLDESLKRNIIVAMETGSGKTHM